MFIKFVLFLHIIGVIGMFAGAALHIATLSGLRRSTTLGQVRDFLNVSTKTQILFPISVPLVLITGLYMMYESAQKNRPLGWMIVALVAFVLVGAITGRAGDNHAKRLQTELDASHGKLSDELRFDTHDTKALGIQFIGLWTLLGIVALMVFKPDVAMSVIVAAGAVAIGFAHAAVLDRNLRI